MKTSRKQQVRPGDGPSVLDNVTSSSCCQRKRLDSETETYRRRSRPYMTSVWNSDVTDTCLRHHLMTSSFGLTDICCHRRYHYQQQQEQQQLSGASGPQECNSSLSSLTVHQLPFECHCQRQRGSKHRITETNLA